MNRRVMIAVAFLLSAISPAGADEDEPYRFVGTWDCEVSTFTFTNHVYNNGEEDLPIATIRKDDADGAYWLTFSDGYEIGLSGFTADAMGWFSPASGDNFQCKRVK